MKLLPIHCMLCSQPSLFGISATVHFKPLKWHVAWKVLNVVHYYKDSESEKSTLYNHHHTRQKGYRQYFCMSVVVVK